VQVKRLGQKVNVDGLRSFMAQLGKDDVGLYQAFLFHKRRLNKLDNLDKY